MDQVKQDRVPRPLAFDKMEGLVREMQDPETGVPVRSQKQFLTSIPSAFMGYDLIEWLMERLNIEESVEAVHIGNQICNYGYYFPVNDSKNLLVKDDGSLYRFQTPYYWPWQNKSPDRVEYAIYLVKRTLRNKQRHGLEEYEMEALASLKKNLANKWDFITMQAEEQVRLAKERKKGEKIVSDSQERAYWRVYRPPPGCLSSLETVPVPNRSRRGHRQKNKSIEDLKKEMEFLQKSLSRTRIKVSAALGNLTQHADTFLEYDPFFTSPQPSNPWLNDDLTFWLLNSPIVEVPTEKRVKRWALSMEETISDPTGINEFTNYLKKEYCHENIRFWISVNDLRRSSQSQISQKVNEIFEEFLAQGAPCEINIDCKTMERVHQEMKNPSRFTFDHAADHVYMLLLKKDCYPRFIRSEIYKSLLAAGVQPSQKKRFLLFGGPGKKKISTTTQPNTTGLQQQQAPPTQAALPAVVSRRRGSDRSLSGSAHELVISGIAGTSTRVTHSHSQSNLSDIPFREPLGSSTEDKAESSETCPWSRPSGSPVAGSSFDDTTRRKKIGIAVTAGSMVSEDTWESDAGGACHNMLEPRASRKNSFQLDSGSSSSELSLAIVDVSEKIRRTCGVVQQTSFSTSEETRTRKLSSTSGGKADSRRASIGMPRGGTDRVSPEGGGGASACLEATESTSTRPSVSSTEDVSAAQSSTSHAADNPTQTIKDNKPEQEIAARTISAGESGNSAPVINISAVSEEVVEAAQETAAASPPAASDATTEPTATATTEGKPKDAVVCPWEDE